MEEEDIDYLLKVVVIGMVTPNQGDSGVGKTNLIQRFSQGKSNPQSRPTIGVDFSSKTLKVKDLNVKAQFWDTAGQEK